MIPPGYLSIREVYVRFRAHFASDAAERLEYFLAVGKLEASYFDDRAEERTVSANWWLQVGPAVRVSIFVHGADQDLVVRESDLIAHLPLVADKAEAVPIRQQELKPNAAKGGRKKKFDDNILAAVLAWTLHDEGFPESKDEMILKMQTKYDQIFGDETAPERTRLQDMVRALFEMKEKIDVHAAK